MHEAWVSDSTAFFKRVVGTVFMPIIPALGREGQEEQEFKAIILSHSGHSRTA